MTPINYPSKNTLEIPDLGANINLAKKATTKMAPVIISNDMTARLPYVSTMESLHIATLQIPGLIKQARQIHVFPKIKRSSLIPWGVLCGNGYTITLYKQGISVQKKYNKS